MHKIRNSFLLVLTALIWGMAFVAQSTGGDAVGPFTFNGIRSFIGSISLLPVIWGMEKITGKSSIEQTKNNRKNLILGGICCGCALFLGSTFQQLGLYMGASVGKAGFLTACYIILVPIISIFLRKKCGWNIWIGVVLSVLGLYLLCIKDGVVLEFSDSILLLGAIMFAVHILVIDYFSPKVDGIKMSCIQFLVCGILSLIPIFFHDMSGSLENITEWAGQLANDSAWGSILYAGVLSCGVGYTLQIIGQNGLNPTVASLLMSLESVFSVLAGWILLGEKMSLRELAGCGLLFCAILLAQIPAGEKRGK